MAAHNSSSILLTIPIDTEAYDTKPSIMKHIAVANGHNTKIVDELKFVFNKLI